MRVVFVVVAVVGICLYLWRRRFCTHLDSDGRSMMSIERDGHRLRGYCWSCHQHTSGWTDDRA